MIMFYRRALKRRPLRQAIKTQRCTNGVGSRSVVAELVKMIEVIGVHKKASPPLVQISLPIVQKTTKFFPFPFYKGFLDYNLRRRQEEPVYPFVRREIFTLLVDGFFKYTISIHYLFEKDSSQKMGAKAN